MTLRPDWTVDYIRKHQRSLENLRTVTSLPEEEKRRRIAQHEVAIAAARRHRAIFASWPTRGIWAPAGRDRAEAREM